MDKQLWNRKSSKAENGKVFKTMDGQTEINAKLSAGKPCRQRDPNYFHPANISLRW